MNPFFSFFHLLVHVRVGSCIDINFENAEHPELYKDRGGPQADGEAAKPSTSSSTNNNADSGKSRQAATDQIMLERFRKRERNRVMRR
jgi:hypothetical protein